VTINQKLNSTYAFSTVLPSGWGNFPRRVQPSAPTNWLADYWAAVESPLEMVTKASPGKYNHAMS